MGLTQEKQNADFRTIRNRRDACILNIVNFPLTSQDIKSNFIVHWKSSEIEAWPEIFHKHELRYSTSMSFNIPQAWVAIFHKHELRYFTFISFFRRRKRKCLEWCEAFSIWGAGQFCIKPYQVRTTMSAMLINSSWVNRLWYGQD